MLVDRYPAEDVFARVPELADQTDPVLRHLDALLDDDPLFQRVRADLVRRYPHTADHGRHSTPAEVILRLLVVKYLFHWSNPETERWVGDSLVLRWFCRVYFHRVPDATTLLRWEHTIQPTTLQPLLDRVTVLAKQIQVTQGRKLRLDGTVVETTIHHPTDSSLLADGVRVLSRVIRRRKPLVGEPLAGVRDAFRSRLRTMRRGLQPLHRLARRKGEAVAEARKEISRKLVDTTAQTVRQARRAGGGRGLFGDSAGWSPQSRPASARTRAKLAPPLSLAGGDRRPDQQSAAGLRAAPLPHPRRGRPGAPRGLGDYRQQSAPHGPVSGSGVRRARRPRRFRGRVRLVSGC
jgi:transposase-like protein DUF772